MRKKPKTGEGRGNKRRQSQPGRDVGGAKHETGRNGQNDKRHGRERTEAGAAKEGNKESEQNKISAFVMIRRILFCIVWTFLIVVGADLNENKIDRERQRAGASAQNEWQRGTEANMRKKPKTGEGRGNKRRQSQPGTDWLPPSCYFLYPIS
ncbi:hypothetical protein TNCV_421561 [Trichonephila clavipes]|nr:hypothetical protein TNCV_421561 [Trichonephila clavipes]